MLNLTGLTTTDFPQSLSFFDSVNANDITISQKQSFPQRGLVLIFCIERWMTAKKLKCVALLWCLWIATIFQEAWHCFFQERRFFNCGCCCSHVENIRHIKMCFPWRAKHYLRRWHHICWRKWNIRLQCFWVKIMALNLLSFPDV